VRYGHTGAALTAGEGDLGALRQRQELEADCYAARTLSESEPETIGAALRFFTRMGPFRFDAWHPSGSQRAAKILACLPSTFSSDSTTPPHTPVDRPTAAAAPLDAPPI
jgi:hypothetical protein